MKRILPLPLLFLATPALALPRPTAAPFARGAQLEVAGYTNANGTARSEALADFPVLVRIADNSPAGFQ